VKRGDCGHEYLLAFSCKRRHFCPSCHKKRVVEFGEWLCQEVLKAVPHRHFIFSIPKILRRYFLCDRKLLSDLSRCGWEALKAFYTTGVRDSKAVPGAVVAIQTFGDFPLGFHPHRISLFPTVAFTKMICFPSLLSLTPKLWSTYSDTMYSRCFLKRTRSHRI
jgi:hypothetical protein